MNSPIISITPNLVLATPLPNNNGYTWTLASRLGDMLHLAQERFGQRDLSYTILGVEFTSTDTPQIWYPGGADRRHIIIQITHNCSTDPMRACYQMAHECIHLLSPTVGKGATVLEEGLATHFAAFYMRERMSAPNWHGDMKCYAEAQAKTEILLNFDNQAIKKLRAEQPHLSSISADLIRKHYPALPSELADQLTTKFEKYPN